MTYQPDFRADCSLCGSCPTVIVVGHSQPDTELCGPHFFADRLMADWTLWNDEVEATE